MEEVTGVTEDLIVIPLADRGGTVTIRICRPKTTFAADNAPLALEHGTLDIALDDHAMARLHEAITAALWHRLRKPSP